MPNTAPEENADQIKNPSFQRKPESSHGVFANKRRLGKPRSGASRRS
jgi:hypothetical protein